MTFLKTFVFLLVTLTLVSAQDPKPCPFNQECICWDSDPPIEFEFGTVRCYFNDTLEPLSSGNQTYKIDWFFLNLYHTQYFEIPANYFHPFQSIDYFVMSGKNADQKWDDDAFAGINVRILRTVGIKGVLPPPVALQKLVKTGSTTELQFQLSGDVQLTNGIFKDFTSVTTVIIEEDRQNGSSGLRVTAIEDDAFQGLEENLKILSIEKIHLVDFPSKAISVLTELITLDLFYSTMTNIPKDSFKTLKNLKWAELGNYDNGEIRGTANFSESNENGVFLSLQPSVKTLKLDAVNLTSMPKVNLPNLQELFINSNEIRKIKKGDYDPRWFITWLSLDSNPIESIDVDAIILQNCEGRECFYGMSSTKLKTLDLAVFDYSKTPKNLDFSFIYSENPKTLTNSNITKIPAETSNVDFRFSYGLLETVDPSIGELLKARTGIRIRIDYIKTLKCNGAEWMAYYAFCTPQFNIEASHCADQGGKPLAVYLKEKVPNPCEQ